MSWQESGDFWNSNNDSSSATGWTQTLNVNCSIASWEIRTTYDDIRRCTVGGSHVLELRSRRGSNRHRLVEHAVCLGCGCRFRRVAEPAKGRFDWFQKVDP